MRIDIITIFPEIIDAYMNASIMKRAQAKGVVSIHTHNLREYTTDKHRKVDDRPYGGGAGMVLMAEPILRAVSAIIKKAPKTKKRKIIILSAKGEQYEQKTARKLAKNYKHIIFITGRYEGIDERVKKALRAEEISMGPYVLTDGDVPAMAVVSSVVRLLPGAITFASLQEESHWDELLKKEKGVAQPTELEYPHYTRPEVVEFKGKKYRVPKILRSGDHKQIEGWRGEQRKAS